MDVDFLEYNRTDSWAKIIFNTPIKDANGDLIKDVIWANLETGEVRQLFRSESGNLLVVADKDGNEHPVLQKNFYPAPLKMQDLKKDC
jgi:hypothetical protein